MSNPILFYSKKCPHCQEILKLLQNIKLNIKLISIEELQKIPNFLKVVPTLLKDQNSQPITGTSVFEWFKSFERNSVSNAPQTNQVSQSQKSVSSEPNGSIEPFFNNEMAGFSDNYSYLGNDSPINHSYQFLNSSMSTNNNKNFNESQSNKEKSFNKEYERMMEARKNDMTIPNSIKRV